MHTLKPNTTYRIVTLQVVVTDNVDGNMEDLFSSVFSDAIDANPNLIHDWAYQPGEASSLPHPNYPRGTRLTYTTGADVEEGEWV